MTKALFLGFALGWVALFAVACSQDYAENCFAKAAAGAGQDASGSGAEGAGGTGVSSGKGDASAESGCSKTPVN